MGTHLCVYRYYFENTLTSQYCVYSNILSDFNKWNSIKKINIDTYKKYFDNVHTFVLGGICDTMYILVDARNVGVVLTYGNDVDGYYVVKFSPSSY